MYIDTHAHFDLCIEDGDITEEDLLVGMEESGTAFGVQISIDVKGLRWSYDFAKKHRDRGIRFSLGIHPSSRATEIDLESLAALTEEVMVAGDIDLFFGIGETGLDYYRMHQPAAMQQRSFEFQIGLAQRHGVPVIVHSREAMDDTVAILKRLKPGKGIMHCFSGDSTAAAGILDLGMYISFAGNLTYKNA
ncbi:MAG TPA: TatD family hydrolase, partial [Spirochaetota bacterium]|nr:TatD family hydrolase [Spirochaetota bacterium]